MQETHRYAEAILERLTNIEGHLREIKIGTMIIMLAVIVAVMKYLGYF